MHKRTAWVAIALTTLGLSGAAWANTKDDKTSSKTDSSKSSGSGVACTNDDASKLREVMGFLHAANQAEIKLGNLAKEKAGNADVKSFADQMVKEHTDADSKLTDLAKKEGIDLNAYDASNDPLFSAIKTTHDSMSAQLASKSGSGFDVGYLAPQDMDHELVLNVIGQGEKVAKSGDEKTFFADARKVVTAHRDHARQLCSKLQLQGTGAKQPKAIGGGPTAESGASGTTGTTSGTTSKGTTKKASGSSGSDHDR